MICSPHVQRGQGPGDTARWRKCTGQPQLIAEVTGVAHYASSARPSSTAITSPRFQPVEKAAGLDPVATAALCCPIPMARPALNARTQSRSDSAEKTEARSKPKGCWLFPRCQRNHQISDNVMNSPGNYAVPTVC